MFIFYNILWLVVVQLIVYINCYGYVNVYIGQINLDFTSKNSIIYDYIEGETIDWSCSINKDGNLKFIYYDSKGIPLFQSDQIYEHFGHVLKFQQLMTVRHNSSYVVCHYTKINEHVDDFSYTTVFNMENEIKNYDDCIVKINDVKLTRKSQSNDLDSSIYEYKYIYGEELTVIFKRKDKSVHDDITFKCENKDVLSNKDYVPLDSSYMLKINTKRLDDNCEIVYKYDHTKYVKVNLHRESSREPIILGLRTSNILYQYTKNQHEWLTHYEYSQKEILNLTCSSADENRKIKLFVDGAERNSYNLISNAMHMNNITCESRRKNNYTRKMIITLSEERKPSLEGSSVRASEGNPNIMYIGVAAGILSAILIIIYGIYWYMKYKSGAKESSFEIFNNEDTSVPAFPSQWQSDYAYIETSNNGKPYGYTMENSMYYSSIQSDSNRISTTDTENHYSEIDDHFKRNQNQTNLNSANYENQNVINNETFVTNDDYSNQHSKHCFKRCSNFLQGDQMNVDYSNIISNSSTGYVNFHTENNSNSNCQKY